MPLDYVLLPFRDFIQTKLCETTASDSTYQYLYACLTLLNFAFLSNVKSFSNLKEKKGGVGLTAAQSQAMIKVFSEKDGFVEKLATWTAQTLGSFNAAFQAGRCSLRNKLEEGMKVGTVDHLSSN